MKATILGAISLLFFLFHLQLLSSSGWMAQNTGKSNRVNCEQLKNHNKEEKELSVKPAMRGPQVGFEVGQGRREIGDQSDREDCAKKGLISE